MNQKNEVLSRGDSLLGIVMDLSARFLVLLLILSASLHAETKQRIKVDKNVGERLDEEYVIFRERNLWSQTNHEINKLIRDEPIELFENQNSVQLPICDFRRPPYEWQFVSTNENERILKRVGGVNDSQFLRWTDSVWVRIAGIKDRFKSGMYCGAPFETEPNAMNYVPIEIDQSFAQNVRWKNTPHELVDGTLVHIASKTGSGDLRTVMGEVEFGLSSPKSVRLGLEIWSITPAEMKMVSSTFKEIKSSELKQTFKVQANIEPNARAHMIFRLHPKSRDEAAQKEVQGMIYLLDAKLVSL